MEQMVPPLEDYPHNILWPPEHGQDSSIPPKQLTYQPLPTPTSIRLIKVLPVLNYKHQKDLLNIPISCTLTVVDLEDNPPVYNALSYTWGDPCTVYSRAIDVKPDSAWRAPSFEVQVNGTPVSVGANLYCALEVLRYYACLGEARLGGDDVTILSQMIWIDALSINQMDIDERSAQVRMMRDIYQQAKTTITWLGGAHPQFPHVLPAIASIQAIEKDLWTLMESMDIENDSTYRQLGIPLVTPETWAGVYMLFARSWFKRIWIIQEIILSEDPLCLVGSQCFPLRSLLDAFMKLEGCKWWYKILGLVEPLIETRRRSEDERNEGKLEQYPSIRLHRSLVASSSEHQALSSIFITTTPLPAPIGNGGESWSIATLLSRHRCAEAGDLRDKVYALVGVCREAEEVNSILKSFPVNYRDPVEKVYTDTARFLISSSGSLDVLRMKEHKPRLSLPSWVPDFSTDEGTSLRRWYNQQSEGQASAGLSIRPLEGSRNYELQVSGIYIADVSSTTQVSWGNPQGLVSFIEETMEADKASPSFTGYSEEDWLRAITYTIMAPPENEVERFRNTMDDRETLLLYFARQIMSLALGTARDLNERDILCHRTEYLLEDDPALKAQFQALERLRFWARPPVGVETSSREDGGQSRYPPPVHRVTTHIGPCESQESFNRDIFRIRCYMSNAFASGLCHSRLRPKYKGRLFVAGTGLIGVQGHDIPDRLDDDGVHTICQGDEVWILAGSDVPILLRRVPAMDLGSNQSKEDCYRLVSEVYMPGFMYGEVMTDETRGRARNITLI